MCDFITAVLPPKAKVEPLSLVFIAQQRVLQPLENASIREQLRTGETYFSTTAGECDCGTVLGSSLSADGTRSSPDRELEREVKRRRKDGWKPAKIESWLRQREATKRKRDDAQLEDLARWTSLLGAIGASGAAPYVGLLLHWYGGQLSEDIRLRTRERVQIADVTGEFLTTMQRDVLYEFRAGPGNTTTP